MKNFFSIKNLILIGAIAVVLIAGACLFYKNIASTVSVGKNINQNAGFTFPEPEFDGSVKIDDTGITVEYPTKGYYGLGADVSFSKSDPYPLGSLSINASTKYDQRKAAEYVILTVGARTKKSGETLAMAVDSLSKFKYPEAIKESRNINIDGHEFYIEKYLGDTKDGWTGMAINGDQVISVLFKYIMGDAQYEPAPESIAAYKNNDKLFLQILEHVRF